MSTTPCAVGVGGDQGVRPVEAVAHLAARAGEGRIADEVVGLVAGDPEVGVDRLEIDVVRADREGTDPVAQHMGRAVGEREEAEVVGARPAVQPVDPAAAR